MLWVNNKKNIKLKILYNSEKRIKLANINNVKKNIKLVDINKQRLVFPSFTSQNRLLGKLFLTFKELILSKAKFLPNPPVLNLIYRYFKSQNNKLLYFLNGKLDYILTYYFSDLEPIKCNVNKLFTNLLIKLIIEKLWYYNTN